MSKKTKVPYERPVIHKIQSWLSSKHGEAANGSSCQYRHEVDGVALSELKEKYGSPLFIYSEQAIEAKYKAANDAFTSR